MLFTSVHYMTCIAAMNATIILRYGNDQKKVLQFLEENEIFRRNETPSLVRWCPYIYSLRSQAYLTLTQGIDGRASIFSTTYVHTAKPATMLTSHNPLDVDIAALKKGEIDLGTSMYPHYEF